MKYLFKRKNHHVEITTTGAVAKFRHYLMYHVRLRDNETSETIQLSLAQDEFERFKKREKFSVLYSLRVDTLVVPEHEFKKTIKLVKNRELMFA